MRIFGLPFFFSFSSPFSGGIPVWLLVEDGVSFTCTEPDIYRQTKSIAKNSCRFLCLFVFPFFSHSIFSWTSRRRDRERRGWLGVGGGGWWGRMKNEELIPNGTDEKSTATVSIPVASSKCVPASLSLPLFLSASLSLFFFFKITCTAKSCSRYRTSCLIRPVTFRTRKRKKKKAVETEVLGRPSCHNKYLGLL